MALKAEFEARYPLNRRAQWSNPDDPDSATQNEALVTQAVTDAEAEFQMLVEASYDDTDDRHKMLGARLVALILKEWGAGGADSVADERERLEEQFRRLRNTTTRARVTLTVSSTYDPSDENDGGSGDLPWSDTKNFDGVNPSRRLGTDD